MPSLSPYEETLVEQSNEPVNPYLETLQQQEQSSEVALRQSIKAASAQTPDRQAEIIGLSQRTGLPSDVIDRNFDAIRKRAQITDTPYTQMLRETPNLAQWLTDSNNAAVAQDDLPTLGLIDRTLNFGSNFLRSMMASIPSTNAALWGAMQTAPDILSKYLSGPLRPLTGADETTDPWARVSQFFKEQQKASEATATWWRPDTAQTGFVESSIYSGAESFGQNLLMLLPAMMTGGASEATVLAGMGVTQGGQSYAQAREKGVGIPLALTFALSQGMIEVATEKIPLHTLLEGFRLNTGFGKLLMKELASEIPGELVATTLQNMNEWAVLNPEKPFSDYLHELPSAWAQTIIATMVGTVGQVGITRAVSRVGGKPIEQTFFEHLGKGVSESKTFQRLPEKLREYIAQATKDGPVSSVYQPIETWQTYWQDRGEDPRAVAKELLGSTTEYDAALASGHDMAIPIADYATKIAPTEHNAFFAKELRLAPEEMNAREHIAFEKALAEQPVEAKVSPEQQTLESSAAQVREDIIGQMVNTGLDRTAVEGYASVMESAFRTMGERAGIDPFELYQQYGLKITRPIPEILRSMPNVDALDAMLDRIRTGDVPRGAEVFGQSLVEFLREKGGVIDEGGDLTSREPDTGLKPFQRNLIQPEGLSLDRAREMAAEAGYLPKDSTTADLVDKIDQELRGQPVYSAQNANEQKLQASTVLTQLEDYLKAVGVDLKTASNEEIKQILNQAAISPTTGQALNQAAYHGSPHIFDKFSLQKIGTGEGAQAYGWGLYFAGNKAVAQYYKETLGGKAHVADEILKRILPESATEEEFQLDNASLAFRQFGYAFENGLPLERAVKNAQNASILLRSVSTETLGAAIKEFASAPAGRLYKVDIPEDSEYLDWDKPLNEQSDKVRAALQPVIDKLKSEAAKSGKNLGDLADPDKVEAILTGRDLYRSLTDTSFSGKRFDLMGRPFTPEKEVSEYLASLGIPGIKYLDQASRDLRLMKDGTTWTPESPAEKDAARAIKTMGGLDSVLASYEKPGIILTTDDKAMLAAVKEMKTDGVTYEAGGTSNYVLFDENLAKITSYEQQTATEKRGAIRFGANRQFNIELLEKADLSTFLHESGHFYLEVFGDTVEELLTRSGDLTGTQRQMINDYGAVLKWLQVADRDMIGPEQHEQWARGFEAYLMEGKAPSTELRSVFARMRAWLVSIYRSLKALNVQLSPEVRGVMDRLLATDNEIAAAQQDAGIEAMFTDAQQAGMSEAEFQAYRATVQEASDRARDTLQTKLMKELQRERDAWWTAERERVQAEVAREVQGQRDYLALAYLQKGTLPDGSALPEGVQAAKLSKEALVEQYGKDFLKRLPRPYVYSVEGGVHPDLVANQFGFSSGDELVKALINARPMKALIEAETDSRMRDRHGDMLLDGSLPDQARAAVFGKGRSEVIQAEMRALAKKQKEVAPFLEAGKQRTREGVALLGSVPPVSTVRHWAETRVAGMPVRDLRPNTYWVAARQAGRLALEAAAKDDFNTALTEKRRELMNVELYRAASDAREDVDGIVDYMRSFTEKAKRERIGKAGGDYLDQIDGLLDRFEFTKVSLKTLDRRKALTAWVADQERQGLPVDLPENLLNEAYRQNYKDMTVEHLVGLRDSIEQIEHLARLKNRLLKSEAQRQLSAAVTEIDQSITANSKGARPAAIETRLPQDQFQRKVGVFFASHRKLSSFIREMDGFKDGGTMWEYILRPINEAADNEAIRTEKATVELATVFDAYKGEEHRLYQKTHIPAIDASLSKMARLMVALNWGNDGNRQRLMDGRGWKETQVQAILDTLDERDWKFVQSVWDHINSYWPEIAAKQKRVTGVAPEKVEATPVETRFGEFKGGYFPIKYENQLSARASSNIESSFADSIKQASYVRATTQRGHTEARLENVKEPVRLDFSVIFEHVGQVIHDLSHHEMLIDVGRILGNRTVQDAIYKHYGDVVYDNLKGSLRDIAFGNQPAPNWYAPINALRQGVVSASLGWNFITAALQPFQLSNAMVRVGPKWVAKGMVRWLNDAASMENTAGWIQERSEFMRLRGKTQLREINEIRNQVGLNTGRISGWINDALTAAHLDFVDTQAITDSYFYVIQKAQQVADIPSWLAGYEKAMAEGNDEKRAIAMADQAVIDSQGSGHIKDLAAVERQPILKLLTTFYSYQNLLFNQSVEAVKKTNFRDPVSFGRMMVDSMMLLFLPAALAFGIRKALTGGDDDKLVSDLIREELGQFLGMMIGFRELTGAVQGRDYTGPAGMRFVNSFYRAAHQVYQGQLDAPFWRSLNDVAGTVFHYPAVQVQRTAEGLEAMWEGKTKNPTAILMGPPKENK